MNPLASSLNLEAFPASLLSRWAILDIMNNASLSEMNAPSGAFLKMLCPEKSGCVAFSLGGLRRDLHFM